jgi:hypothetical protein
VIIRHEVGVPGLKKVLILLFILPTSLWLSCGGYSPSSSNTQTSGLKYRAFITNDVSAGSASAGVYVVDASKDVRPPVSPISAGSTPGMMLVTPNRALTLVFSGDGTQFSDNIFSIINNASESNAAHLTLPGITESFVVSPDSSTAYVAVPGAQVVGQSLGIVEVISLGSGAQTGEISCPPVNPTNPVCIWPAGVPQGFNPPYHFLSIGNSGNRVLAFSEGPDSVADIVAVITPSSLGTASPTVSFVPGFDHPVAAFFSSDDTTAYVLNCGRECGGTQASIQTLDLRTNTAGPASVVCTAGGNPTCIGTVDVVAGSVALLNGSTLYVAGTPAPPQPCIGQTTAATSCGRLSIVDLSTLSVTNAAPISITDGYHNRIAMAANGQLFIGARTCTEIGTFPPPTGAEVRGCLSIYNSLSTAVGNVPGGGILIPPANGDVTGIQPIATRQVVYVVQGQGVPQGGTLYIYDATTDTLEHNPNDPSNPGEINGLIGNFVDVKTVDF